MNPNLTSAVSELSKGRSDRSSRPSLRTRVGNLITRVRLGVGGLVSFAFVRVLMILLVGFAAGMAWQSYGGAARKTVASWSPRLSWLAPSASSERIRAMSVALAAARQNLDKVANEMSRLEVLSGDAPRRRPSR